MALEVTPNPENVVSSRLEGHWEVNTEISNRLGHDLDVTLEFKIDHKVVQQIPETYAELLADYELYTAGNMTVMSNTPGDESFTSPFILIEHQGNPHIVFFVDSNRSQNDVESFNVMLAAAEEQSNDLLFIGGDFNNQAFAAYQRK